jgi:four helix bundle protein
MSEIRENILLIKSHCFAVEIIKLYKLISKNRFELVLPKQILRSGTSIGALVREAQNAESRAYFVHKLGIAQKECDETIYWLELLNETNDLADDLYHPLKSEAESLLKIIKSSILTAKKNMQK